MLIVADETQAELMDSFENSFIQMAEMWTKNKSLEAIRQLEAKMFLRDSKSFRP